jgi:hypothetical protein
MAYTPVKSTDCRIRSVRDTFNDNLDAIQAEFNSLNVEGVADLLGAMVSDNTETGITATYDDSTNKLNLAVTYGTAANTACQGNDSRLLKATSTLTEMGIVPPTSPAWSGTAMAALTGASTFQQLLDAINTDIATAATLPT